MGRPPIGEGRMERKININNGGCFGIVWFGGWLFSIGYLHLGFWQGLLGLIVWPYFMGAHFAPVM